ncbi:MAG TPA: hypothetical protein VGD94_03705 [Vicinamibacterales bacterium]
MTDLESKREILMLRKPRLVVDRKPEVLDDGALTRTMFAMAALPGIQAAHEHPPFDRYLEGVIWLSKSDVHMELHAHAFGCFYESLRRAIEVFEGPDAARTPADRVEATIKNIAPKFDESEKYLNAGEQFVSKRTLQADLTLDNAAVMKLFCDAYFNRLFKDRMRKECTDDTGTND